LHTAAITGALLETLVDDGPAKGAAMLRRGIPRGVCTLDDIDDSVGGFTAKPEETRQRVLPVKERPEWKHVVEGRARRGVGLTMSWTRPVEALCSGKKN
jgi:hypothetical protein